MASTCASRLPAATPPMTRSSSWWRAIRIRPASSSQRPTGNWSAACASWAPRRCPPARCGAASTSSASGRSARLRPEVASKTSRGFGKLDETEDLRSQQERKKAEEKRRAREAESEEDTMTHERRAERSDYLSEK